MPDMSIIDEIFVEADRNGQGLAEYVNRTFSKDQLIVLEADVKSEINELRINISDFMSRVTVPDIRWNLQSLDEEKLNLMQIRIQAEMSKKRAELEDVDLKCYVTDMETEESSIKLNNRPDMEFERNINLNENYFEVGE